MLLLAYMVWWIRIIRFIHCKKLVITEEKQSTDYNFTLCNYSCLTIGITQSLSLVKNIKSNLH